jgi:hypothetical protein
MGNNKGEAHRLALEFWELSGKSTGVCDRCNATIQKGDGYVCKPEIRGTSFGYGLMDASGIPDLMCETCFDKSPTAEPFDREGFRRYMQVPEVVQRAKSEAHVLAVEFWKKTGKSSEKCAHCRKVVSKGEGYICKPKMIGASVGFSAVDFREIPDLVCESCFDNSRTTIPFDRGAFNRYIKTVEKKWWQFGR